MLVFNNQYKEYTLGYRLVHILIGVIIYIYKDSSLGYNIFLGALAYQTVQYMYNIRFYISTMSIKKGINTEHFLNKLYDHILGFMLAYMITQFVI